MTLKICKVYSSDIYNIYNISSELLTESRLNWHYHGMFIVFKWNDVKLRTIASFTKRQVYGDTSEVWS
jgi:hypothetical protein